MPALNYMAQLRARIADDAYAGTFQSFGQYRTALLNLIESYAAQPEPAMTSDFKMPLATTAYPASHPYPTAVRRVYHLEKLLLSGVVVQLDGLTKYTATAHGGMQIDKQHGPWVLLVDVMGRARKPHAFTRDAAETFAQALIAQGWHNGSETCVDGLQEILASFMIAHAGAAAA